MSRQRYPEEFKDCAVKQITERGHKVPDVSARLGVSPAQSLSMAQDSPHVDQ